MKFGFEDLTAEPWFVAAAGSMLGLKAMPGASLPEKIGNLCAGFLIATFGGPALIEWLPINSPKLAAFAIFGLGACGLVLWASLIEGIRRTDFGAWLTNWLPRRKGD